MQALQPRVPGPSQSQRQPSCKWKNLCHECALQLLGGDKLGALAWPGCGGPKLVPELRGKEYKKRENKPTVTRGEGEERDKSGDWD